MSEYSAQELQNMSNERYIRHIKHCFKRGELVEKLMGVEALGLTQRQYFLNDLLVMMITFTSKTAKGDIKYFRPDQFTKGETNDVRDSHTTI